MRPKTTLMMSKGTSTVTLAFLLSVALPLVIAGPVMQRRSQIDAKARSLVKTANNTNSSALYTQTMTANVTNDPKSTPATRPTSKPISSPVKQMPSPSFAKKPRNTNTSERTSEPTISPVPMLSSRLLPLPGGIDSNLWLVAGLQEGE